MEFQLPKINRARRDRLIAILVGIAVNVGLDYLAYRLGLPFYIDTIGTITIAALGGPLPGVITAMATNILCSPFHENMLFFSIISVLIALATARCVRDGVFLKKRNIPVFALAIAVGSGILGTCLQWIVLGGPEFEDVSETAQLMVGKESSAYFFAVMLVSIGMNLVDKGISVGIALLAFRMIPEKTRRGIWNSGWKQTPLGRDSEARKDQGVGRHALKRKITLIFSLGAIGLVAIMIWISIVLYNRYTRVEYTRNAVNAARFAAQVIDGDSISEYLSLGESAPGYQETRKLLEGIRENAPGVEYLYAVKIESSGCTFIFDLDTEDVEAYEPGDFVEFEEAFKPYLPDLYAGREINPIESEDRFGSLLTAYIPVKNSEGGTACYVGADVSTHFINAFAREFVIKSVLVLSGFFVLILCYGIYGTGFSLVYPIRSMTVCAEDFVESDGEQKAIDESVRRIKALDIRTGDEIEKLYRAVSKMEADMAEQVRDLRRFAETTARMQNGLIITMADMVENRDSDTGAHIQKTAAYVRIILYGLKRKGYYVEKLTHKYMDEVEMSAPLHDVGKISIPDAVLNKPGKLTDEEFEIMKTHTTEGKRIMENAISTVEGENYLKEARNMAAYHHERWDGKGYPEGLMGNVIPLSARVMAVADVFDALTSPRVYKPAFPLEKAISILEEGAGKQFDPKVVEVFLESMPEVKRVLRKYNPDVMEGII